MDVFYCVTIVTSPFTHDNIQVIGCYTTNALALKVVSFIREIITNNNVDIKITQYQAETIYCDAGIRLKDTSKGCITMIYDKVDRKEYIRLLKIIP
jgi:hypothetical protein